VHLGSPLLLLKPVSDTIHIRMYFNGPTKKQMNLARIREITYQLKRARVWNAGEIRGSEQGFGGGPVKSWQRGPRKQARLDRADVLHRCSLRRLAR
jgi:hypothetical protein